MPQVLIVSREDWANMGFYFEKALKAAGLDAKSVTEYPHAFAYPEQAEVLSAKEIKALGDDSDVIIHMHSRGAVCHKCNAHHVVFHGGQTYRQDPDNINSAFNRFVDFSLVQTGDLLGLGAKNEVWLLPPVDLDLIRVRLGIASKRIKIAHYPRNPTHKGSLTFETVMARLKKKPALKNTFTWDYDETKMPYPVNLERMAKCDVYLESFLPVWLGRPHLSWGLTALEAAALGKIVVTGFKDVERYEKEYGPCALQVANTEKQITEVILRLLDTPRDDLERMQVHSREWVEKFHSFQAIGERLKAAIEKYCWTQPEPVTTETVTVTNSQSVSTDTELKDFDAESFWRIWGGRSTPETDIVKAEAAVIAEWLKANQLTDKSILEVGSGDGLTYQLLTKQLGASAFPNYKMVDFVDSARNRCKKLTGILPDYWDGIRLPYENKTFDTLISTDVLLHVPPAKVEAFIREHVRVMKSFLIVSTYIGPGKGLATHCFKHDYEALFKAAGINIVDSRLSANGQRCVYLLSK